MGARRSAGIVLTVCIAAGGLTAMGANPSLRSVRPDFQADSQAQSQTRLPRRPISPEPILLPVRRLIERHPARHHHTTVEEEVGPPPELTKAEEFIQKQNFTDAEPLLRKVADADPANYVAWFDLGFVYNALGKIDDSIAAYRKSVAAKPDVFESNLNLGLQLAKNDQPEAQEFLRSATQLKPTSHVAAGQERAWLSLAHLLEA